MGRADMGDVVRGRGRSDGMGMSTGGRRTTCSGAAVASPGAGDSDPSDSWASHGPQGQLGLSCAICGRGKEQPRLGW
jgi:hypothetical protein